MALEQRPVLELIWNLVQKKTKDVSKVTYHPQKEVYPKDLPFEQSFPRCQPEEQDVSSKALLRMLNNLTDDPHTHMHQLMMLRHGHVICECGFAPYPQQLWHATYSLCKTVTGMAIGMLIDEDRLSLDDRILDFFPKDKAFMSLFRQRHITVRHLLTMSSGVVFNESGIVSGDNWVQGFLESNVKFAPGTEFEYNSMNSYMLSAIVTAVTNESMMEYLTPRLWQPLGITRVSWGTCPMGITKGGWGLFLCPEDAAKLGQLYLQHGQWNGEQILSKEWVEEATAPQIQAPEDVAFGGYGYQLWQGNRPGSYLYNGMLGQNVFVFPDLDTVLVTNGGNNYLFQQGEMMDIVRSSMDKSMFLEHTPSTKADQKRLKETIQRIKERSRVPIFWKDGFRPWRTYHKRKKALRTWLNKGNLTYDLEEDHVGLFPIFLEIFYNNYPPGIHQISFQPTENGVNLIVEEEKSVVIPLKYMEWIPTTLNHQGEEYQIASYLDIGYNEDDEQVLTIQFAYLEEAVTRQVKITCKDRDNSIEMQWTDQPGKEMIFHSLAAITKDVPEPQIPFVKDLPFKAIMDMTFTLMEHTLEPKIKGKHHELKEDIKE